MRLPFIATEGITIMTNHDRFFDSNGQPSDCAPNNDVPDTPEGTLTEAQWATERARLDFQGQRFSELFPTYKNELAKVRWQAEAGRAWRRFDETRAIHYFAEAQRLNDALGPRHMAVLAQIEREWAEKVANRDG